MDECGIVQRSVRSGRLAGRMAAGVLAVSLSGCVAAQANRAAPGAVTAGRFAPSRHAPASYGVDPTATCGRGGALEILDDDLAAAAKKAGKVTPQRDPRLCEAAEALLGWDERELVPVSVARFAAWNAGLPSPQLRITMVTLESEQPEGIGQRLFEITRPLLQNAVNPRYGAVTLRVRKGFTKVCVVVQDPAVEVQDVPRRVAAGATVTVTGQLLEGAADARVVACDASGKLVAPPAQTGKAFRVEIPCGERPGRLQVEIRAQEAGTAKVVGNFPVFCGTEPPVSVAIPEPSKAAPDPSVASRKLLDLMNASRAEAGLGALRWDDTLAGVARANAESLRDARGGGPTFDLEAALRKADISSPLVLQNAAAATNVDEVNAVLDTNPVDRAHVLASDVTHAGVAVVPAATPQGVSIVYATELFLRELPEVDPASVRPSLRATIAKKRAAAKVPALSDDPLLDQVAQTYAGELAAGRGSIPKAREDQIVAPLYKAFRTVNILSGVKADPQEFAQEPGLVGAAKALGIGAAQGTSAAFGKNSTYVVIITGTRR